MNENNKNFIKETENGLILTIKLTPNSSKNEILGYNDEYVKIKVSAPPNENKANKKLIDFISEYFDISKSNIDLISGSKARLKKIQLKNINIDLVKQKIFIHAKIDT